MKSLVLAGVFVLLLGSALGGGGGGSEDPLESLEGIVDLTPETFSSFVNGGKHALVEFYAPWCGHCKRMVPELKKLGSMLAEDPVLRSRVVVGKVNADDHKSLGEKYEIRGFPTLKYFARGQAPSKDTAENYESGRTAEAFFEFLKKKVAEDSSYARVPALDAIAAKFIESKDKKALVAEATGHLKELADDVKANAEIYIKFMEKAIEKGVEYFTKEKARLEKMISSGSVNAGKLDELSKKASVLGAFLPELS